MKTKLSKQTHGLKKAVAAVALFITTANANSTCMYITHQPELPQGAKKLRKF